MSCCDCSSVTIDNQSGQTLTWKMQNVVGIVHTTNGDPTSGSCGNNGAIGLQVWSASHTGGAASGQVYFTIGDTGESMTLSYNFQPKDSSGHCPCTSSGYDSVAAGNYSASAKTTNCSKKDSSASITWTVIAGFLPPS